MGLPDPLLRQQPDAMPLASRVQYEQHPIIGQTMLSGVEQLVEIARWIRHHHERWDGRGYPDRLTTVAIPLPSRIIALADGYLSAVARDGGTAQRWRSAQRGAGAYDPDLLEALTAEVAPPPAPERQAIETPSLLVPIARLEAGMRLAETLHTAAGAPLLGSGEVLSEDVIVRVKSLAAAGALASDSVRIVGQLIAAR
jgi:HD domain-containing protein